MKRFLAAISTALLLLPGAVLGATNCDDQAKPVLSCPTGYSMTCIPTGGDHWGCGRENAGGTIDEANPVNPAPTEAPAAVSASGPTDTTAASETVPTTTPSEQSAFPGPSAPPMPNVPVPTVGSTAQAPTSPTDATLAQAGSASAEPEAVPLEGVQGFLEEASEYAPASIQPILEAIAWTLGTIIAFLGLWEWVKRMKEKKTGKCGRCGETKAEKKPCGRCEGTGKIEEEYEMTVKCTHCKGSGTDPCHHCGGTGKMPLPNPPQSQEELEGWPPCDFCGGSGVKKVGAGRDWGEANDAVKNGQFACCFCHGKKQETVKLKREVACPDCKGTGKR